MSAPPRLVMFFSVGVAATLATSPVAAQQVARPEGAVTAMQPMVSPSPGPTYMSISWGDARPPLTTIVTSFSFTPSQSTAAANRMAAAQPTEVFSVTVPDDRTGAFATLQRYALAGRAAQQVTMQVQGASGQLQRKCVFPHAMMSQWSATTTQAGMRPMFQATFAAKGYECSTS